MPWALSPDSTPPSSPFSGLSQAPGGWRGPGWSLYPQARLLRDPTHLRQTPESHLVARRVTLTGPRVSSLMAVRPFSPPVQQLCHLTNLGASKESDPTRAWQTYCGIHSPRLALHLHWQTHLPLLSQSHGWPSFLVAAEPCHIFFKATTHGLVRTLEAVLPEGASPTQQPPSTLRMAAGHWLLHFLSSITELEPRVVGFSGGNLSLIFW